MYEFLNYNDIVRTSSSGHKGRLKWGNKSRNKVSKSMNKNFRQNLVNRVTKTNGPKMANRGWAILLRDESYQCLIKIRGDFPFNKNLLDFMLNRITNIPLEPLEEASMNTIRP